MGRSLSSPLPSPSLQALPYAEMGEQIERFQISDISHVGTWVSKGLILHAARLDLGMQMEAGPSVMGLPGRQLPAGPSGMQALPQQQQQPQVVPPQWAAGQVGVGWPGVPSYGLGLNQASLLAMRQHQQGAGPSLHGSLPSTSGVSRFSREPSGAAACVVGRLWWVSC